MVTGFRCIDQRRRRRWASHDQTQDVSESRPIRYCAVLPSEIRSAPLFWGSRELPNEPPSGRTRSSNSPPDKYSLCKMRDPETENTTRLKLVAATDSQAIEMSARPTNCRSYQISKRPLWVGGHASRLTRLASWKRYRLMKPAFHCGIVRCMAGEHFARA
jgi:hypothetical protein